MATYYLGWSDILWSNNSGLDKHIYLVKDTNGNLQDSSDQRFIRGTAENTDITDFLFGGTGSLLVEAGEISTDSRDGLDNVGDSNNDGFLNNDKNKDGVADTVVDRHYTQVTITDAQWAAMEQLAVELNSAGYEYGLFDANCQAIVVSMLSLAGLDFEQNVPVASSFNDYVSRNVLLSGAGSDTLYGFSGDDTIYDRNGGDDNFHGGDALNQVRFDIADGVDKVHYDDENETGTLKVYDAYRSVQEGSGGLDVLYSIEKVSFEAFDASNTLDYSNYSSSVDVNSLSLVGRLAEPGDARTAVAVTEAEGQSFEAINFGAFKLTDHDDVIRIRDEGVAESVIVDTGAGNDEISVRVEGAQIFAGAGADEISDAANGTIIYTGAGDGDKDIINIGSDNVLVADAGIEDRFEFLGRELTGSFKMHDGESSWTQTAFQGVKYSINANGDLVIQDLLGRQTFVGNYQYSLDGQENDTAGILVFEMDIAAYGVLEVPKNWLGDTLVSIENIIGSEFNDVLVGNNLLENELWGLGGNDNIQGRGAQDIMHGGDGTDTIRGGDGDDILYGNAATDYLYGNADDDYLDGGAGVDALWGHTGADTFGFTAGDAFTGSDNIKDFSLADGDKLDVSDLLQGYDPLTDLITDFVEITDNGTHSYLKVDVDGGADNFVQVAQVSFTTGLTDEGSLETNGTLITV